MAKTLLAFAAAFFAAMTVFASAAEAGCISCDHVPVVVRGSQTSDTAKDRTKKRTYTRTKKRTYTRTKKRKTSPAKKVDTAKTAPVDVEKEEENSTISAASAETNEAVVGNTVQTKAKPKDEPKTTRKVACKKFFPSVGMTLTVACEDDG